jgi:DNA-binding response OmpR family regulator
VLVVDDEAPLRELVVVTLAEAFECEEAADGDTAIELLHERPFDIVVLDVMMPGRNGLDVLREIRSDERLSGVRTVVLSAWQAQDDITAAAEAGADRFVSKPFDVDELVSVVQELAGDTA